MFRIIPDDCISGLIVIPGRGVVPSRGVDGDLTFLSEARDATLSGLYSCGDATHLRTMHLPDRSTFSCRGYCVYRSGTRRATHDSVGYRIPVVLDFISPRWMAPQIDKISFLEASVIHLIIMVLVPSEGQFF
jgi:hypothetical protein